MIDFTLSKKQRELKEGIHNLGKFVIRPMSLEMDQKHDVPEAFLRNFVHMAASSAVRRPVGSATSEEKPREPGKISETNRTAAIASEELAWADAAVVLSLPGPASAARPCARRARPSRRRASSACSPTSRRARSNGARTA